MEKKRITETKGEKNTSIAERKLEIQKEILALEKRTCRP